MGGSFKERVSLSLGPGQKNYVNALAHFPLLCILGLLLINQILIETC